MKIQAEIEVPDGDVCTDVDNYNDSYDDCIYLHTTTPDLSVCSLFNEQLKKIQVGSIRYTLKCNKCKEQVEVTE